MSFALQKLFSFMRSDLLILDLSACTFGILFKKLVSCANAFKTSPHFLFDQVQGIWFYDEVFDPLGFEFSVG